MDLFVNAFKSINVTDKKWNPYLSGATTILQYQTFFGADDLRGGSASWPKYQWIQHNEKTRNQLRQNGHNVV